MKRRSIAVVLSITIVFGVAGASHASSPEICAPTVEMDRYRLLRQISLDLRGRIPTIDEYRALDELAAVPDQLVDEMLESEEFYATMREYHRNLVWPTLDSLGQLTVGWTIGPYGTNGAWYNYERSPVYRGKYASCLDVPQTAFDAAGRPIGNIDMGAGCPATGCKIDGYVMIEPYWAPGTQIKMCAFDAQAAQTGTTVASCDPGYDPARPRNYGYGPWGDPGCGCGPNLQWCTGGTNGYGYETGSDKAMRVAITEEPLRIFEAIIRENRPYFDALTTKETYINGPLVHYLRYAGHGFNLRDARMGALPAIPFTDRNYVRHERDAVHSGILTTEAYLVRFATNRARADRFYSSFLCKPFVAPVGGLPPATDPSQQNPNLSTRTGCATCHTTLEPAASHWGRWENTEYFGYLDPARFTPTRSECGTCTPGSCPEECLMYYVTQDTVTKDEERPYLGTLRALEWRSPEEQTAVDAGPSAMVAANLASGDLARCSARTLAENMLNRHLTDSESLEWVPELATDFTASSYNFKQLMREIVFSDRYRQIH